MSDTRRKILLFAGVFLPAFVLCLWLYPRVQPAYQEAVVAGVDAGLHRLDPPMRIEITADGGWATYTLHPDGTESFYWSRPGHHLTLFYIGLALLPALLVATPVGLRRRAVLLGIGLLLLFVLHVVAGLGLVLSIRCLAEDPGVLVCQWGKTVGNTFGQVAAFVIWGLLTWNAWLPGAEKIASAPGADTVGRGTLVRNPAFASACIVAVGLLGATYLNHFPNGLHFAETDIIVDNLSIRSLGNAFGFFTDPHTFSTRPENAAYRPALTLSHAVDYWAGAGAYARQFRRTQFALLLALGAALVFLCKRLFDFGGRDTENRYVALFAALLCCVHFANAGTVNSISARPDLVAGLGITASFCLYLARPDRPRRFLALLPMLVGALAAPVTLAFAPLLVAFAWLFEEQEVPGEAQDSSRWRHLGRVLRSCAPAILLGLSLSVLLIWMDASAASSAAAGGWAWTIQQPFVWAQQAYRFVLPAGMPVTQTPEDLPARLGLQAVGGAVFLGVVLFAIRWCSRIPLLRPTAFGLAWFAITSLAVSVCRAPADGHGAGPMFVPSIGLAIGLAWLAACGLRRLRDAYSPAVRWLAAGLAVAVVSLHAVATRERNPIWRDDATLWAEVLRIDPDDARGLVNYGRALVAQGRSEEALEYLERARNSSTGSAGLELELALATAAVGRADDAEGHFRQAIAMNPRDGRSRDALARWLTARGRGPEAIEHLVTAAGIGPTAAGVRWFLMNLHAASGNEATLEAETKATLAIVATDPVARAYASGRIPIRAAAETAESYAELARQHVEARRWVDAAVIYRHAIALDPAAFELRSSLAWARMQLGFLEGAVAGYRAALEIDPTSAPAWNDLGWALGQQGRFDSAGECFAAALRLDPTLSRARANLAWARRESARN